MFVADCASCQKRKSAPIKKQTPLKKWVPSGPWDRIAMDLMGPLPLTPRGNGHVLLVANNFTKWVEAFPVPEMSTTTVVSVLVKEVFYQFGTPRTLHSDLGTHLQV